MKNLNQSFSRAYTVLTSTFLFLFAPLFPRTHHAVWFNALFMCSNVTGSNRERRRLTGKSCHCQEKPSQMSYLLVRPLQSCTTKAHVKVRKKIITSQPCWPAARQSAPWYAGLSQHIFAPLYRSIFWKEKYLRGEILNSRTGGHVRKYCTGLSDSQ